LEKNSFLHLFLLNEMTHFVKKTASFHSFFIEKKTANDVVLMALFVIFFHLTRNGKGRRFFFPSFVAPVSLSLSLLETQKNKHDPHSSHGLYILRRKNRGDKPCGWPWGSCPMAAQPPYPFNTIGQW
jgi:hypothetical protein